MDNEFKKPTFELLEDTKPAAIEDDSKEVGEQIVDILKKINMNVRMILVTVFLQMTMNMI